MKKKISALFAALAIIAMPAIASAHVTVKPAETLTGSFLTFSMGAPNEKDIAVTKLKLDIPKGLQYVQPSVKTGWTITTEKTGEGVDAAVTSITWDGGTIPAEQRDDFTFSAKVPDTATDLTWKAYQTYEDGTTVAWDQKPSAKESDDESSNSGPYSVTSVVKTATAATGATAPVAKVSDTPKYLSIAALVVAVLSFAIATRPHKHKA